MDWRSTFSSANATCAKTNGNGSMGCQVREFAIWISLHAKCYLSEQIAIVTSMNFYEYSQNHNYEIGIIIDRSVDSSMYNDICAEVERLWNLGEIRESDGSCIRCNHPIDYNPEHALCDDCFQNDPPQNYSKYRGSFCHPCGHERDGITYARPMDSECYRGMQMYAEGG